MFIHRQPNQQPAILKDLSASIEKRVSYNTSANKPFNQVATVYADELKHTNLESLSPTMEVKETSNEAGLERKFGIAHHSVGA